MKASRMDGIIVNYDPKSATGTIRTKDGQKFSFRKADWYENRSPRRNYHVDFQAEGETATGVCFFQKEKMAGAKAAPVAASMRMAPLDFGLIAGGYAIVFFLAAIFDAFFNVIGLDPNDIIA